MTIGSLMSRMGTADKLSIPQIQQAIQDGTLPAYVGIPLLQDKIKQQQAARAGQPVPPQPTIAEQVMSHAQAEERPQGIPQLQSNLPAQGMAGGGIVAFAGGGYSDDMSDDDYEDSYDLAEANQAMDNAGLSRAIMARANPNKPAGSSMMGMVPDGISSLVHRVSETFSKRAEAPASSKEDSKNKHKYYDKIVSEAAKLSLSPDFALRIAQKETGNLANPESAVSPAGALGVMQLMPQTARGLGVKDPMNPDENIAGGVRYAKQMLDKYGDEKLAAMAYNWGPGNVDKWLRSGKGIDALPRETQKYAAAFAEGGSVKHFQVGGLSAVDLMNLPLSDVTRMAKMSELGAAEELMRRQKNMGVGPARMAGSPAFSTAAPAVEAAAPAAAPTAAEGSLLSRASYNVGNLLGRGTSGVADFLGQTVKSPLTRGTGVAALLYSPELNTGEDAELARRQAMPATITPAGQSTVMTPTPASMASVGAARRIAATPGDGRGKQGGPNAADLSRANFEKAVGATQDTEDMEAGQAAAQAPAKAAPAEEAPSAMDEYLKMLKGGYADVKKQREEDKYLALLAAGLGMMGGTSPYAAANIGAGGLHGISSLMEANKQRAAEQNALDRAYGQGLYRQSLQENTAAQREAQLQELIRSHDLRAEQAKGTLNERAAQHADTNLANAVKLVSAAFTGNIENVGKSDAEREAYVYSHPLVKKAAAATGLDLASLQTPGQTKYTEKQQSLLDKYLSR